MHTAVTKEEVRAGERQSRANEGPKRRAAGRSILVVDGERLFCELVREVFERQGYAATCCNSTPEAIEKARSGTFDAVMFDINTPDMLGYEALEIVRRALPESPLTMVTRAERSGPDSAPIGGSRRLCLFAPLSYSQSAGSAERVLRLGPRRPG